MRAAVCWFVVLLHGDAPCSGSSGDNDPPHNKFSANVSSASMSFGAKVPDPDWCKGVGQQFQSVVRTLHPYDALLWASCTETDPGNNPLF